MVIMDESCKDCLHYAKCRKIYKPHKVMDTTCKFCLHYNNCKQIYKVLKLTVSSVYGTQVRE